MSGNGGRVTEWLLEDDNPSVKYWTLRNLLDYHEDDPLVVSARRQIMQTGPVPQILARLNEAGHYVDPDTLQIYGERTAASGYLPKYRATTWQLLLFATLGAEGGDDRVRRTCDYVLQHCWQPSGLFTIMDQQFLAPCFQGNMVYALTALGYGHDPRVLEALDVLLGFARFDDGDFQTPRAWPYHTRRERCSGAHSCYAGALKALQVVAALPAERRDARVREFADRGADFFLKHRVFRASHSPGRLLHKGIDQITFPNFVFGDFLEVLTTLLVLGFKDAQMQDAIDLLRDKRLANGRWRLDRDVPTMHVGLGRKHRESKWATYRALYALRLWEA